MTQSSGLINLAHFSPRCGVLGPGNRAVLWVQGCHRGCPGCIAAPMAEPRQAGLVSVEEMVRRLLDLPDLGGVTFSGGEPFEQAGALADLCEELRARRDLSLMSYTGYTLEELTVGGDADQRRLLGWLDILVDGPFELTLQADLLWRGSSNQRVHLLTSRHHDLIGRLDGPGAGIELVLDARNRFFWQGVPPLGFERRLRRELARIGIDLTDEELMAYEFFPQAIPGEHPGTQASGDRSGPAVAGPGRGRQAEGPGRGGAARPVGPCPRTAGERPA